MKEPAFIHFNLNAKASVAAKPLEIQNEAKGTHLYSFQCHVPTGRMHILILVC